MKKLPLPGDLCRTKSATFAHVRPGPNPGVGKIPNPQPVTMGTTCLAICRKITPDHPYASWDEILVVHPRGIGWIQTFDLETL